MCGEAFDNCLSSDAKARCTFPKNTFVADFSKKVYLDSICQPRSNDTSSFPSVRTSSHRIRRFFMMSLSNVSRMGARSPDLAHSVERYRPDWWTFFHVNCRVESAHSRTLPSGNGDPSSDWFKSERDKGSHSDRLRVLTEPYPCQNLNVCLNPASVNFSRKT